MMTANGLAKLLEECGELSQIAAKKLAYMHTDAHPDNKGSLKTRLENEIADVLASAHFVIQTMALDKDRIASRSVEKVLQYALWHADNAN